MGVAKLPEGVNFKHIFAVSVFVWYWLYSNLSSFPL